VTSFLVTQLGPGTPQTNQLRDRSLQRALQVPHRTRVRKCIQYSGVPDNRRIDLRGTLKMLGTVTVNVVVRTKAIFQLRCYNHTRSLSTCASTEQHDTPSRVGERGLNTKLRFRIHRVRQSTQKVGAPPKAQQQR
jgi:hypothetical protein